MRFHIDVYNLGTEQGKAYTNHMLEGTLPDGSSIQDLLQHPHARGDLPGGPCYWMGDKTGPVTVISAKSALEVAGRHRDPLLLAAARAAEAVGGHLVLCGPAGGA